MSSRRKTSVRTEAARLQAELGICRYGADRTLLFCSTSMTFWEIQVVGQYARRRRARRIARVKREARNPGVNRAPKTHAGSIPRMAFRAIRGYFPSTPPACKTAKLEARSKLFTRSSWFRHRHWIASPKPLGGPMKRLAYA